jgi:transposase-like protein
VARISDEVRAAVVADLRQTQGTPEGSMRQVGDRHGVSLASVRRIAAAQGLAGTAARVRAENATAVAAQTNAQRRERLAARMLDMAERALDDMIKPATVFNFGGKDNTYNERELSKPPTADQRNLATIAAIAVDKHAVLERFDSAGAAGQQAELLLRLLTGQAGA